MKSNLFKNFPLNKIIDPKRGKVLTIMLVLSAIFQVWDFTNILRGNHIKDAIEFNAYVPNWYTPYYIVMWSIYIPILIGIWLWKKWVVYFDITTSILQVFLMLYLFRPLNLLLLIPVYIVFYGVYLWAIFRKWQYFK
ncbi:hypothetical protein A2W45_04090 [Candidatus Curtissbacteria bacterium RIFCSPHIGHO2_12_41_11]|uniref:Uncharacterized protein n=2 Tax=Candidatus Curtissiibacteriota TaxID=1752717 RepID=A0A1F5H5V0_9BACT|nr:MAG: hypothetical protein A3D07_03900 [Candidatus Curtissbacteria bacterium RIFCSPHIGHO2_02_FULL_42_15]OGD99424.1 MAG: hypothetical protein A2W45_04090 [Candidatus Curtissbacteria bacterium RIFCSPHIGHO2_12_41_11]